MRTWFASRAEEAQARAIWHGRHAHGDEGCGPDGYVGKHRAPEPVAWVDCPACGHNHRRSECNFDLAATLASLNAAPSQNGATA